MKLSDAQKAAQLLNEIETLKRNPQITVSTSGQINSPEIKAKYDQVSKDLNQFNAQLISKREQEIESLGEEEPQQPKGGSKAKK